MDRAVFGVCVAGALAFAGLSPVHSAEFIRGDSNSSGVTDISDAISTLGCLFGGAACPDCLDPADANDDGRLDLSDAVFTLNHLFTGGSPPPPPYPTPGFDPTTTDEYVCGDAPENPEPGTIIISEIHFHPLSGDPRDEFIELYNRGPGAVNLQGFTFTKGVDYTFGDVQVAAGAYLVVAGDAAHIQEARGITNVVGDWSGVLDDGGETVRLKDSADALVDEVHYDDGGLWPTDADGYGSSLELIDLHGDNDDSTAWGASDEARKSSWTPINFTAQAAGGSTELHILLVSQGECLVDNLQVLVGGQNRIANGSFENNMSGWLAQGTHRTSTAVTDAGAVDGSKVLHLIAQGRGDTSVNRIECNLTSPVSSGQSVTIRGSARWLRGSRFLLLRLHGNVVAQSISLAVPPDGGTPGGPNSIARANVGPSITGVNHLPILPSSAQAVKIAATIADAADGVSSVQLSYRVEPSATVTTLDMNDAGADGDSFAGDGVWTSTIPKQSTGKLVAFWITAQDGAGAENTFPSDAPARTALYRVGEPNPATELDAYHVWMPAATVQALTNAPKMGNELFDITFVYNNTQVFYNAKLRYRGSPFIRAAPPTDPVGGRYAYRIDFGEHQPLNGESEIDLDNLEPGRDPTLQRENVAYLLFKELGLPYSEMTYVRMWFNGNDHGVYSNTQKIDKSYVQVHFPEDQGGNIHKVDDYFEFDDNGGFSNRDAHLTDYGSKKEEYRWNFEKRDTDRDDDWTNLQTLARLMNTPAGSASYVTNVDKAINPENWVRVLAIQKIIGNWDSFGYNRGKNMYMYRPPIEGRWYLCTWDMDFLLGNGDSPSSPLFGGIDAAVNAFLQHPKYKKMYLSAFRDLVDGPFSLEFLNPHMDATYNLLRANTSVADPSSIRTYITQRRNYVLSQLPSTEVVILTNGGADFSTSESSVTIEGDAPLEVESFRLNGTALNPTITGISKWSFRRSIPLGSTTFTVEGLDASQQVIGSDSITVLRVEACVPASVEPAAVAAGPVEITIHGSGYQESTQPAVHLASASTEPGFAAFYAERGTGFGDINEAEDFLDTLVGAVRTLSTTHTTISRRTEGGGEIFPTTPFPSPWNSGSVNDLAARYTGFVHVPSPGTRTFGVNSDDGFRLRIDGKIVCEYPPPRGPAVTTGTFNFPAAGSYPIELTWYENGGGDIVQLFQETAGGDKLLGDDSEATVTLDDPLIVTGTNVIVVDPTVITAQFDMTGMPPGAWTVEIQPALGSSCTLEDAITLE